MSTLFINPNSIYNSSQENFILNKEALYAFTRSVSTINNSIYGMQPTKEQLLCGFELSDIYEKNPRDTNYSLCATVDKLDEHLVFLSSNTEALEFFATKTFVPCSSETERNKNAKNPLAIYLTPISETSSNGSLSNNFYEWIYTFNPPLDWQQLQSIAVSAETLSDFHLTSVNVPGHVGKWELIGTTSITDGKLDSIVNELKEQIALSSEILDAKINSEISARTSEISVLHQELDNIKTNITTILDNLISQNTFNFSNFSQETPEKLIKVVENIFTTLSVINDNLKNG